MIVIDTSAIMAMLFTEPEGPSCLDVVNREREICISAGTLSEAKVVAAGRAVQVELDQLLEVIRPEVVPVTGETARSIGEAYALWGKGSKTGQPRADLNFGDCFAYVLAKQRQCPLLFIGKDFAQTDVVDARALRNPTS